MHNNSDTIYASSAEACKSDSSTFYNLTTGGVDVSRKTTQWSLSIDHSLLNTAGINSYTVLTTTQDNETVHR